MRCGKFVFFIVSFMCLLVIVNCFISQHEITEHKEKYTIDELLNTVFPKKTSNDLDMDPCKAGGFMGDIALPDIQYTKPKQSLQQEEVEKYKQEVLEGLQIEEEGMSDYLRKKTKQPSIVASSPRSLNDPVEGLLNVKPLGKVVNFKHQHQLQTMKTGPNNDSVNNDTVGEEILKDKSFHRKKRHHRKETHHRQRNTEKNEEEIPVHDFEPNFDQKRKKPSLPQYRSIRETTSHRRATRAATARKERVWNYGVIPYEIDGNFSGLHKALFKQAMRHWENFTCVKFVERNRDEHVDYITFTERPCGCCSFVGKRGNGGQAISIGKNCDKFGIVVHELGHVVGFWHEHTRPDRDRHVDILRENIMNGQDYNFNKLNEEEVNSLGLTYDYDSIMHYARNTFSKGTYLDTIQPVDVLGRKRPEIGQRIKLSEGDIAQTNLLYKCPQCGRTFQMNSANFSPPVYSDNYPEEGIHCEWRITATHGEKIVLNITGLDIKKSPSCKTDYIEIRDGYWHKSPVLGLFCGTGQFNMITSTGSRMLITYIAKNPKGHKGFQASYEAVCGGDLKIDSKGHLESPNYPEEYHPNKECIWRITVPESYQVALKFQSFEVENHDNCVYDYVEIRDGLSKDSSILKVHCGYKVPDNIISSSNELMVKFVSDGSVQKAGFSALIMKEFDECSTINHSCEQDCKNTIGSYECTCRIGYELHSDGKKCEDACGGIFNNGNGTITSPSFPELYPLNKNCVWEIRAAPQYRITLNFTHFDLEGNNAQQQQCDYDSVEIESLIPDDRHKSHGVFCGSRPPTIITSEGNVIRIRFSSDNSVQKTGFAAVYFTDMDECAAGDNGGCQHECRNTLGSYICTCHNGYTLHENGRDCKEGGCKYEISSPFGTLGSPNYPDLYPQRRDCVWHFIATPGQRIRLAFIKFEVESHQECSYDHVDFYDGGSPEAHSLGRFCGSKVPHPIVSSGNQLYMTFRSDNSVQRKGFSATHATVCGGKLQATLEKKHIYSHARFGSSSYDNKADCDWTIEAMDGYSVKISFLTFDVEDEKDCGYDYVEIFNGIDSSGLSYGKFCGTSKPHEIISSQEGLLIRFRTDDTLVSKGFSIVYEAVETLTEEEI
ncbi:unnamed protein product [Brassicogethes aeneus]|uniref:Metalloendopeptidase n=1 Tax=Brassicogethes aeneus TaxID=1431903 RepID=A0A9P0FKF3_BRAAE|nr:unnamed protein product [Brassicogethes aeneus]